MSCPNFSLITQQFSALESGQVEAIRLDARAETIEMYSDRHLPDEHRPQIVFPGAFNPLHEGHRRMAHVAEAMYSQPVAFELSILNVDKHPLEQADVAARAAQFLPDLTLWLTRAATFQEKANLFPGCRFVVGADTIVRVAEARYYGDDPLHCERAIEELAASGCRFLVFGRHDGNRFQTLSAMNLPSSLLKICDEVPTDKFRHDISSTELRGG